MDDEYYTSSSSIASQPLPTPTDTPYDTPFLTSSSRRSSTQRASSGSHTPLTPTHAPDDLYAFRTTKQQNRISITQQQDLTPSLHASLVSEILALRREKDSKDLVIDRLELNVSDERSNNELLHDELKRNTKETRGIKDQLKLIEESTLVALEELCHDRDVAIATSADLRRKGETLQKDLKAEREHGDRLQSQSEAEKSRMTQEKTVLSRRAELAESRLKAVLEEIAAQHTTSETDRGKIRDDDEVVPLGDGILPIHSSPRKRGHRRNKSSVSTIASVRQSTAVNGLSLADELEEDEGEEEPMSENETASPDKKSKNIRDSRRSGFEDAKTRKVLGMFANLPEPQGDNTPTGALDALENKENMPPETLEEEEDPPRGTVRRAVWQMEQTQQSPEVEANQRRKRDPLNQTGQPYARAQSEPLQKLLIKRMSSPDRSPSASISPHSAKSFVAALDATLHESVHSPTVTSSSTQTEEPLFHDVPAIAIHPPDGGSTSPLETVLPPGTKSIGCQTTRQDIMVMRSTGMQTEIIRVDQRPVKLPPHLLPSALNLDEPLQGRPMKSETSSLAVSPLPSPTDFTQRSFTDTGSLAQSDFGAHDASGGNWARLRRNLMMSARNVRSPDDDPFYGTEDSAPAESDYATQMASARAGKRAPKYTRPAFDPPTPVPEDEKVGPHPPFMKGSNRESLDRSKPGPKAHIYAIGSKGARESWRYSKEGSVKSGSPTSVASSSAWSKFTSNSNPPVPVPPRVSSAGMSVRHLKRGGRTSSPTPRGSGSSSPTKRLEGMRINKKPGSRKVKSQVATPLAPSEPLSQPVSAYSRTSFASNEYGHAIIEQRPAIQEITAHNRNSSTQTRRMSSFLPTGNASVGPNIQHTVVDAIAQTMVGEWMWKYVRKQNPLGFGSSSDGSKSGETRHKRWVWISPYERTVMWGSKPPTNEAGLMGKSGRRLTIQSVLDVKDDTVSLNVSRNVFNRAILILTPTRALKFTAFTRERHYLWLTALSFLSHHTSQGSLDLSTIPRPFANEPGPSSAPTGAHNTAAPSRTTSRPASRSSRKPWSYKARSSRQSSGYATPSIPERSAAAEGFDGSGFIPPPPNRPAPTIPPEHYFPDVALAPAIPRVPASRSSSRTSVHGRKRSVSITGILTSRPSTQAHSGRSSLRNLAMGGPISSGNRSGRASISGVGNGSSNIHPPLPNIAPRQFPSSSVSSGHAHPSLASHPVSRQPSASPTRYAGPEPTFGTPRRVDSLPQIRAQAQARAQAEAQAYPSQSYLPHLSTANPSRPASKPGSRPGTGALRNSDTSNPTMTPAHLSDASLPNTSAPDDKDPAAPHGAEFAANLSFFDAASAQRYKTASIETDRPSFDDEAGAVAVAVPVGREDAPRHQRGESFDTFDSVAPPPIAVGRRYGVGPGHVTPPVPSMPPPPPPKMARVIGPERPPGFGDVAFGDAGGTFNANGTGAQGAGSKRRWFS